MMRAKLEGDKLSIPENIIQKAGLKLMSILLGWMPILERMVYVVVALAAIYLAAITAKLSKR